MTAVTLQNPAPRNESRPRSKTGLRTHDPRNWAKRVGPATRAQGGLLLNRVSGREIRFGRALAESPFTVACASGQNHTGRNPASGGDAIFADDSRSGAVESAATGSAGWLELGGVSALSGWPLRFGCLAAEDSSGARHSGACQSLSFSRGNLNWGEERADGGLHLSLRVQGNHPHRHAFGHGRFRPGDARHLCRSGSRYGGIWPASVCLGRVRETAQQGEGTPLLAARNRPASSKTIHLGGGHQKYSRRAARAVAHSRSFSNVDVVAPGPASALLQRYAPGRDFGGHILYPAESIGAVFEGTLLRRELNPQAREAGSHG